MINYKARCNSILISLVGDERMVQMWWSGENKAFNMQKPVDVIETDPKLVYGYLIQHMAGEFL
jgi:hypothetical protein